MSNTSQTIQKLIDVYRPGFSLPAEFYFDSSIYQTDLESIFCRRWIYAGHISQLSEPGEYFLVEFGNESIIVVRGKDNEIRAFANVCRHRGSRVCLEHSGRVRAFVCPYHAWTYELDGSLRSRREMPTDFEQDRYGLKSVGVGVFQGLIFINLDPDAPDLTQSLSSMDSSLEIYKLDETKIACQKTFEVNANWKLAIENFMECYHCAPAHPEYSCSHTLKSPRDYAAMRPAMIEQAAQLGYQTESIDNSVAVERDSIQYFYNRSAMYEHYVTGSESGKPVASLLGDIKEYGGGAADIQFGPVTYAILYPDHAVIYRFLPSTLQKTNMDIIWLVNRNAKEGVDYNLDELTWLWTVTTEADKKIILNNQKGVNSRYYDPGPLSNSESFVTTFIEWYLEQIKS